MKMYSSIGEILHLIGLVMNGRCQSYKTFLYTFTNSKAKKLECFSLARHFSLPGCQKQTLSSFFEVFFSASKVENRCRIAVKWYKINENKLRGPGFAPRLGKPFFNVCKYDCLPFGYIPVGLTRYHYTGLKRLARDKQPGLFGLFIRDEVKMFCN